MPTSMIGSGLDIPQLVSSLVSTARKPAAERIAHAEITATAKLSAISKIKQSLSELKTSLKTVMECADTPALSANVPSDAGFTASASAKAVPGHYRVEVVQLASAHKLASSARPANAHPGAGSLNIQVGSQTFAVEIGADATLADIAKTINAATDNKGVTASVISADDGQHLVLTAHQPGQAHALTVSASGDAGLQALATGLTTQTRAADAVVKVDGFERTLSGNSVDDLLPGVTLTLTNATKGKAFTVEIKADNSALKSSLDGFVKAWNATTALLKTSSAYQPETKKASALTGDSLVRGLQQQLRGQISADLPELKALGVTVDKDGQMKIDAAAFDKAVASDLGTVKDTLGQQGHYSHALSQMLETHLNSVDGSVILRHQALNEQVKDCKSQITALDERMQKLSDLYTTQFIAMERTITQMQSSASALDNLLNTTAAH